MAALRELPSELVSKAGGPVKLGLKAGAQVLLDEMRRNVRAIIDAPNQNGGDESTGLLLLSLQAKRSKPTDGKNGEAFVIGIKRGQKYPAFRQNKAGNLTAVQIGRQLEYGTEKRDPMLWLRPAYDAKRMEAVNVTIAEIRRRTEVIIKRLERQAARSK